jgi:hypothetical protein
MIDAVRDAKFDLSHAVSEDEIRRILTERLTGK